MKKEFPNGFSSWQETHFEVVSKIQELLFPPITSKVINEILENNGTGGIYELAEELTDKFEQENKGREWDGEFYEEVDKFLNKNLVD